MGCGAVNAYGYRARGCGGVDGRVDADQTLDSPWLPRLGKSNRI